MSIRDWGGKINPVVNLGDTRSVGRRPIAKIYYGVKREWENVRNRLPKGENVSHYYTAAVIILVGLSSFGLGRLSILDESREPMIIEPGIELAAAPAAGAAALPTTKQSNSVISAVKDQLSNVNGSAKGAAPLAEGGKLVASRNGTKYYFPWCGSAAKIAEANKIWFNSVEEAKKAGYTPASNCKGLK